MPKTICVIDDDTDITESVRIVLESEGFQVKSAESLDEGRKVIDASHPDLIILDVTFPDNKTDGFDFCRQTRENQKTKDTPIIMYSNINKNYTFKFDVDKNWLPADMFLNKPVQQDVLVEKVKSLLK